MYQDNINASILNVMDDSVSYPLLMPRWGYALAAMVLFTIGFFGFFLNLMVILLMIKDRQLWTPLNMILFNLMCSDFSVSILGNPFTLTSALFHRWIFGHTMCVLYGFFMALLGITSITTLTVLAFERYMLIGKPLTSNNLTKKGAGLSIVFIWSYSLALTTPPLLGWGSYTNEAANISCSINWHEQSTNTLTYILYLFLMGQIIPMSVITYSYYNIVRTMKQNAQRLGRVSKAEAKVTTMVFIMIVAFTVAWTPYSVFALLEQFATSGIVSPGAGVIPALVAKSSICYNPLIYVGMNTQFRQSIKRVFGIRSGTENMSASHKTRRDVTRYSDTHDEPKVLLTSKENATIEDIINTRIKNGCPNQSDSNEIIQNEIICDIENNSVYQEAYDIESPVLNIVNPNKLVYAKNPLINSNKDNSIVNVYSNKAFEEIDGESVKRNL